ncbi:potassium channel family protein [Pseudoalteromonas piscicida]|uniref:Potassium channel domain-containing protein n=1 Tax=Pseudoalteromonas piscicida TaxID=43662 RepID=A0ABM6NLX9_PSEO7|nr:potassium channel family protein [Pseudoalteromonas piscicida]ATD09870.1 hypothetical protein PPIS_b0776 [Pseudoalteromonas piscicida]WPU31755.1 potassium channel family protein [Pseudoalteromonas piscicida]
MEHEIDYQCFVTFLKEGLEDTDDKKLNELETLVEFYEEFPPDEIDDTDSDYAKEELERIARAVLPNLRRKLHTEEKQWLMIKDGKFVLVTQATDEVEPKDIKAQLNNKQLDLIDRSLTEIDNRHREALLSLFSEMYEKSATVIEQFELLEKIYLSYQYSIEKDVNYIEFLRKLCDFCEKYPSEVFYKDSYKYYEDLAKYYRAKYEHADSAQSLKSALLVLEKTSKKDDLLPLKLKFTRAMRIQYGLAGDEPNASETFIEENKLNRRILGKSEKSWIHIISDNCQNPSKVAKSAFWLVLLSTIIFSFVGIKSASDIQSFFEGDKYWYIVLWDSFYFSVVTFTTLGYGDFSPGNGISRVMANIVSVSGLLLSSLFLVTLVRKYGR